MSDRKRKYSTESSDESFERNKRKKSKYHHKEHKRKHKKEHKREEKRSSQDRKKYKRHDQDRERNYEERREEKKRSKEIDQKYKSSKHGRHEKYEKEKKNIIKETKNLKTAEELQPILPTKEVKETEDDLPCTSTKSDIKLPSYYNSSVVNAQKFAEQQQKRKLLWQNKKNEESNLSTTQWTNLKFSQDNDGTKANKFMRLMGIKDTKEDTSSNSDSVHKSSDEMLKSMEQQYEVARNITHLSRGVGFGFK